MDESQYQLGIRKLSPHEMVSLIIAYRNELRSCESLCRSFAEENYAQDPLHKVACAYKAANLDTVIHDYKQALNKEDMRKDVFGGVDS